MPPHPTAERIVCSGVKKDEFSTMNGLDYALAPESWLWQNSHGTWRKARPFRTGEMPERLINPNEMNKLGIKG